VLRVVCGSQGLTCEVQPFLQQPDDDHGPGPGDDRGPDHAPLGPGNNSGTWRRRQRRHYCSTRPGDTRADTSPCPGAANTRAHVCADGKQYG
jgi:hypothetical protein